MPRRPPLVPWSSGSESSDQRLTTAGLSETGERVGGPSPMGQVDCNAPPLHPVGAALLGQGDAAAALATTSPAKPATPPTGELHLVGRPGSVTLVDNPTETRRRRRPKPVQAAVTNATAPFVEGSTRAVVDHFHASSITSIHRSSPARSQPEETPPCRTTASVSVARSQMPARDEQRESAISGDAVEPAAASA